VRSVDGRELGQPRTEAGGKPVTDSNLRLHAPRAQSRRHARLRVATAFQTGTFELGDPRYGHREVDAARVDSVPGAGTVSNRRSPLSTCRTSRLRVTTSLRVNEQADNEAGARTCEHSTSVESDRDIARMPGRRLLVG